MQVTGNPQGDSARQANRRRNVLKPTVWNAGQREDDSARGHGYDFLRFTFEPIPCSSIVRSRYSVEAVEYITQDNYEYLLASYRRYAELLERPAPHDPGCCIGEAISNLVTEMSRLVADDAKVNVDYDYSKLYFTLYTPAKWESCTLYWLPVKFMERLTPKLRRIGVSFFHELMCSNGLSTLLDDYDMEMTEEWIRGEIDQLCKKDSQPYLEVLHCYDTGRAYRLLNRIENKSYYKNLPRAIRRYVPSNEFERRLVALLEKGLQFIGTDKPRLMDYDYDPYEEEEPDEHPIELQRQVRLVYDLADLYIDELEMMFNYDQQETRTLEPYLTKRLSPETDTLFDTKDDYTGRFCQWAHELYHLI